MREDERRYRNSHLENKQVLVMIPTLAELEVVSLMRAIPTLEASENALQSRPSLVISQGGSDTRDLSPDSVGI